MYKIEIDPRFKDTDALGHINNASFITWIEEARRRYLKNLILIFLLKNGI